MIHTLIPVLPSVALRDGSLMLGCFLIVPVLSPSQGLGLPEELLGLMLARSRRAETPVLVPTP